MRKNVLILFRILLVLYLVCMGLLCFGYFPGMPQIERRILGLDPDKVVHFLMFLPFPVLAWLASGHLLAGARSAFRLSLLLFLAGCILAAGTEIGQYFLPYRSADPKDLLADGAALALSSLAVFIVMLVRGNSNARPER